MEKKYIGVIGSGEGVDQAVLELAEEIGRLVAEKNAVLVCGGRMGVMEAACRGAKSAAGLTVGILPGMERDIANPYVDVAIPTGLGYAMRNFITVRSSDALIMLHGEVGTLSEAVMAYQHGKPLVALESSGGWSAHLKEVAFYGGAYLDERQLMHIHYAKTASEAVSQAFALIGSVPKPVKI